MQQWHHCALKHIISTGPGLKVQPMTDLNPAASTAQITLCPLGVIYNTVYLSVLKSEPFMSLIKILTQNLLIQISVSVVQALRVHSIGFHFPLCQKNKSVILCLLFLLQMDKLQPNSDTVFFRDGVRRIDFVLSYVDDKDGEKKQVSVAGKWQVGL